MDCKEQADGKLIMRNISGKVRLKMKKTVLLAALLLSSSMTAGVVCAEGLPYTRTLPQYTYYSATLLTPESYPQVCINPEYESYFFGKYHMDEEKFFLTFPGPDGALAESYRTYQAEYIDETNAIQYTYYVTESDSFEEFVNKAAADEYIIADGMDGSGTAAYIDPERCSAYGMIATKQFGKSSKLRISISLDSLSTKMPLETRVENLTQAITAEVARVAASMQYVSADPYWSRGKFAGVKLLDSDFANLYVLEFPTLVMEYSDGSSKEESMILVGVDGYSIDGIYDFGYGEYLGVDVSFDSYSYVTYKMDEGNENATKEVLDNGSEWLVYLSYIKDDGTITNWYASKDLGIKDRYDKPIYATLEMDGENISWQNKDDVLATLSDFDTMISVVDPASDVYVPVEIDTPDTIENTPEDTQTSDDSGEWICPNCGTANTGKFCSECGTGKPWTCPECGQTDNAGKFCSNCGTARP